MNTARPALPGAASRPSTAELPRWAFMLLLIVIVLAWGTTWMVIKTIVLAVPPFWTTTIRSAIATVALLGLQLAMGQFVVPRRGDLPVVVVMSLFHMIAFSVLITTGLKYVPVGRSMVLAYTMPLWVVPGAWLFLREATPPIRLLGLALGVAGLLIMFNPLTFDWSNGQALYGNGLLLLSALAWSISIVYVRAHVWVSSPFQMVFWQALLATLVLSVLALWAEGAPAIDWSPRLAGSLAYAGLIGSALAFWAMNEVNRRLPATTTALGVLATPVVGIVGSALFLGEALDPPLVIAAAMILGGIAVGTIKPPGRDAHPTSRSNQSLGN